MAGLIAGHDPAHRSLRGRSALGLSRHRPDARIVSVKVGTADGGTDVSQAIAAIDWVVQHAQDPGLNIRVLNLSAGPTAQLYTMDPRLRGRAGVGSMASSSSRRAATAAFSAMNNAPASSPAFDPLLLAVGASDAQGTDTLADDLVPSFSPWQARATRGRPRRTRYPSAGLRVPNSYIDANHPRGLLGDRYFRGSGRASGGDRVRGGALVLQKYPSATPDQVRRLLTTTGIRSVGSLRPSAAVSSSSGGPGRPLPTFTHLGPLDGIGSLELARGLDHISMDGVVLDGERTSWVRRSTPPRWPD
jgi:serine protease AprX